MKIGYCFTGSFCTFARSFLALRALVAAGHEVVPIMSENAYSRDTRFSDEYFQYKMNLLAQCDESADIIVLPEYSDIPAAQPDKAHFDASIIKYNDIIIAF